MTYANPNSLVSTEWLAEHLGDPAVECWTELHICPPQAAMRMRSSWSAGYRVRSASTSTMLRTRIARSPI